MIVHHRRRRDPTEVLQVVLDDATVERLRTAAEGRGIEVEQLIVHVIHTASWQPVASLSWDDFAPDDTDPSQDG